MAGITTADVTDFRARLLKKGQSANYVKKLLNVLHRFFGDAVEDGYLRVSPMPQRRRKRDRQTEAEAEGRALTYVQAQMLLRECEADAKENRKANPELRLIMLLALLAGLRRGEILALHFSDIDWDNDVIHVRRNLFWRHGKHHGVGADENSFLIYTPKSKTSVRDVDLSPTLKNALWERYMEMQMRGRTGLVFQSRNGSISEKNGAFVVKIRGMEPKSFASEAEAQQYLDTNKAPLDPNNVYERWFKPAVQRAKRRRRRTKTRRPLMV